MNSQVLCQWILEVSFYDILYMFSLLTMYAHSFLLCDDVCIWPILKYVCALSLKQGQLSCSVKLLNYLFFVTNDIRIMIMLMRVFCGRISDPIVGVSWEEHDVKWTLMMRWTLRKKTNHTTWRKLWLWNLIIISKIQSHSYASTIPKQPKEKLPKQLKTVVAKTTKSSLRSR